MILSSELEGKTIFLSASYPEAGVDWPEAYKDTLNPGLIAQGVKALLKAVFMRRGKIVFGGHPTITPFVIDVAEGFRRYYGTEIFVFIYQSRFFEDKYPEESKYLQGQAFARFVETEVVGGAVSDAASPQERWRANLEASLLEMRTRMFSEQNPAFGVFIGGKDGIVKEFDLMHQIMPMAKLYPIATSGGAASMLLSPDGENNRLSVLRDLGLDEGVIKVLFEGKGMPFVCEKIIRDYLASTL